MLLDYSEMIANFRHRGLERLFKRRDFRVITAQHAARIERILDRRDSTIRPEDMNLPGSRFHALEGERKAEFAVTVSGNWRITSRVEDENTIDVNLQDYHR